MLFSLLQRRIKAFFKELRAPLQTSDLSVLTQETPVGAAISMLNGAIIVIAGWGYAPGPLLLAWGIYTVGLNGIVLGQSLAKPPKRAPVRRAVSAGTIAKLRLFVTLQAAPWGALACYAAMQPPDLLRDMALVANCGMAAGAAFMLHRVLWAAVRYLTIALGGVLVGTALGGALHGGVEGGWAIAAFALIYGLFLNHFAFGFAMLGRERDKVLADLTGAVNELEQAHDRISTLAYADTVTGLPNRKAFMERLERETARAMSGEGPGCAALMLDLDRFKAVNDSHGHAMGDKLLQEVAARLRDTVRGRDMVARLGGDEFAVITGAQGAPLRELGERIVAALAAPVSIDGVTLQTGTSVGAALCPRDGSAPDTLLRLADIALNRVKETGRGRFQCFDERLGRSMEAANVIADALRGALSAGDLKVRYQPKIRLSDGAVAGAEALVRWRHPLLGQITPDRFLPVAAERGMMREVTNAVLGAVLRDLSRWRREGADIGPVAINLHPLDMKSPEALLDRLRAAKAEGFGRGDLIIEITEGCFIGRGGDAAWMVIDAISEMGFELSLDDFGTGQAALSHLRALPVSELKIDRTFVSGIVDSPRDRAIVSATLALARGMDMRAVAEGIETEEQLEALRSMGAELGQGHLWARSLPADELLRFALERKAA